MIKSVLLSTAIVSGTIAVALAQSGGETHSRSTGTTTATATSAAPATHPAPRAATTAAPAHAATQAAAPPPAPTRDPRVALAVPDQHGYHRLIFVRALDKITGRAVTIAAPAGRPVKFGTLSIVARYCHTTPPEEPPDTSAFLQITELKPGEQPVSVFSGWMFASSPSLNGLEHPVYDVWVTSCVTDEPAPPPPPKPVVTTAHVAPPAATVSGDVEVTPAPGAVETPSEQPPDEAEEDVGVGSLPTH